MMKKRRKIFIAAICLGILLLALTTFLSIQKPPDSLVSLIGNVKKVQVLDRFGRPLTVTYQNRWNTHNYLLLHKIPPFLQKVFVLSEDKRFYRHRGCDWLARGHALWQNIKNLGIVRGASTITEQVVRMVHPRSRNPWSRWIEGFEASLLEDKVSKEEILEFYLNQVPYASHRRGVFEAASYYFDRDLETLSQKEMILLTILARSPSRLDLYKNPGQAERLAQRLAEKLRQSQLISEEKMQEIQKEKLSLKKPTLPVNSPHFVSYVIKNLSEVDRKSAKIRTTLDSNLQSAIQKMLDSRKDKLKRHRVENGAVLVVDHQNGDILAWVVAGNQKQEDLGSHINAILTPRQPGSALKPFLYAAALEKGWTAATLIDDSPLSTPVATGVHSFRNYSRTHYGSITLREALANSLNIPAVKTLQHVGLHHYLDDLRKLGFHSLRNNALFYGDGLALGNGEVSLYELVKAYTALANRGYLIPLRHLVDMPVETTTDRIYSAEVTSLIGNILSDSNARRYEFGRSSVMDLPVQTAVKTGTSTDFRDAWTMGYNFRYLVGIWMGNLNQLPMDGITGSGGPAILLRGIFARLNQNQKTQPLYLSPKLISQSICQKEDAVFLADGDCLSRTEWFVRGTKISHEEKKKTKESYKILQPTPNLRLALDPRIPRSNQAFEFVLSGPSSTNHIQWELDGKKLAKTRSKHFVWNLKKGKHHLGAAVLKNGKEIKRLGPIHFVVQ